jgi:hypothetical protein
MATSLIRLLPAKATSIIKLLPPKATSLIKRGGHRWE